MKILGFGAAAVIVMAIGSAGAAPASAQQFRGMGGGHRMGGFHASPRPIASRPFRPGGFAPHHFHHRFFRGFAPFGVVYVAPPFFYGYGGYGYGGYDYPGPIDPPAYYSPAAYAPPVTRAISIAPVAPPPPTVPSVVEYSTGRYELRGDGTSTPYVWVWIPNPPPGPPPHAAPGAGSTSDSASRHQELYRWTDEQGVLHLTDRWQSVPARFRDQAKQPT